MLGCASLALGACGGDSSAEVPQRVKLEMPNIKPSKPIPTEMEIRDLSQGAGPTAELDDEVVIEYHAVDETGAMRFSSWLDPKRPGLSPLSIELGVDSYFDAFDDGIEGMRLGSRREIFFPAELTKGEGPLFYVVDLVEMNRDGSCSTSQPLRWFGPNRQAKIRELCDSRVRIP